ncbi:MULTISPECIES: hypothetical protein [Sinorhizobium]|uniref:hypothetical protein n=1 Tax=Sinorhizobium TaxID=28105 RepID=UPI001F488118|nr:MULTISPECIES: hypothetical protein [Sinorhizobium]
MTLRVDFPSGFVPVPLMVSVTSSVIFPQLIGPCADALVPFIVGGHWLSLLSEMQVSADPPASHSRREHRRVPPAAEAKIDHPWFVGKYIRLHQGEQSMGVD